MADATMASAEGAISFGPFSLLPGQRLLLEGDKPVRLGSRALDILIALVDRPGELVGKAELMARVWRGTFVDEYAESENRSHIVRFQVDLRASARTFLAPVLWLLGFPDQATHMADAAIADARAANHAMSLCHALAFGACPTALFAGDLARGEHYARLLFDEANRQGLARWHAFSRGYQGALLIKRGNIAGGLELLRAGSAELGGFATLRFMDFLMPEALWRAGEIVEGLATVDEAIARSEAAEEHRLIAELLRIKGELLHRAGAPDAEVAAEDHFRQALDWARRQGALSWELRAATSFARLLRDRDRIGEARDLLAPIYERFTEGSGTSDLREAKRLIDGLS